MPLGRQLDRPNVTGAAGCGAGPSPGDGEQARIPLTPDQAEQMASALLQYAGQVRAASSLVPAEQPVRELLL